jgi:hypothetical protein
MTFVGFVVVALATYLLMRRRGRVFLEPEEGAMVAVTCLLAVAQRLSSGSVNLNDHFITPLYFALPIVVGHARGPARGATSAILSGATICILAACLQDAPAPPLSRLPGQHLVLIVLLGITGAGAGMRHIPKALKPLLALSWLVVVAVYHPEYLSGTDAYVTQFSSIALASLGLYFNPIKPMQSVQIHYPTSPSRRA